MDGHETAQYLDETWRLLAACRGKPTELWYPPSGPLTKRAREVCESCPVQVECYCWAVESGEISGFWGGVAMRPY